jgi:hypothetical protein
VEEIDKTRGSRHQEPDLLEMQAVLKPHSRQKRIVKISLSHHARLEADDNRLRVTQYWRSIFSRGYKIQPPCYGMTAGEF